MQTHTTGTPSTSTLPAALAGRDPLSFEGQRVLTTELAARVFGATEKQLQDNYLNNEARFEAGKHFHKVEGAGLRALKNRPDFIGSVGRNARSLTLWTERGIARHAKILETETAWAIFGALEDTYFRARSEANASVGPKASNPDAVRISLAREARLTFNEQMRLCKALGITGQHAIIAANHATKTLVGVDRVAALGMRHMEPETDSSQINATTLGQQLGLNPKQANKSLTAHSYQTMIRTPKGRLIYEPTEKGRATGGRVVPTAKKHDDGTPVTQVVWSVVTVEALRGDMKKAAEQ